MIVQIGDVRLDLTDAQVEDLRRRLAFPDPEIDAEVAAREERADEEALIGTTEAARLIGMSEEFVRDHAAELGGVKLTGGPRARWAFDPAALRRPSPAAEKGPARPPSPPPRRRRRVRSNGELLPVRGERP